MRRDATVLLERIRKLEPQRESSIAATKTEEAGMWLGKYLGTLREPDPYPHSRDPSSPTIDPPAPEIAT